MQWNNLYLIPIVLVGGLLAFGAGRTIVARVLASVAGLFGGAANKVAATVVTKGEPLAIASYSEPPPPLIGRFTRPLAQRKEELAQAFLASDDEWDRLATKLKEQDDEEARRVKLLDEARKRNRSNNVLVGKLDVPVNAGPLTTAIQVNEELLATLKAARNSQK